ncbi:MAG: hydrolase [Patescibacteria group bacterium]
MENYDPKTDCCPPFDPSPWDGKTFEWQDKKFIKDKVCCAFNVPMNFGKVMTRVTAKINAAGAKFQDWMALSEHTSMWKMNVYLAVDRDIPGAENTTLSGKFISKVYEGNFGQTGKWCQDFAGYAKQQGHSEIKKMYLWYTTCPKCAKKYGKNYVVIIAKIN